MDLVRTLGVAIDPSAAKSGGAQASSAFKAVGESARGMEKAAQGAEKQIGSTGAAMGGAKRAGDLLRDTLERQNAILTRTHSALETLTAMLGRSRTATTAVTTAQRETAAALTHTTSAAKTLTSTTDGTAGGLRNVKAASDTAADSIKKAGNQARDTAGRFTGMGTQAKSAAGGAEVLSKGLLSLKSAAAAFGIALGAAGMVAFSADLMRTQMAVQRTDSALRFASGGADEFAKNKGFARSVTSGLGLEQLSATREFAKFMAAGKGTEFSSQELRDVFLSVAQAASVLGLTADETAGTLNALQQMISKGTVQAEELRGQLGERLPGAFQLAARAMGVTTAELGKMLERGEVTAYKLLPALGKELQKAFGAESATSAKSLSAEVNRLANSWTDLKDALFKSQLGNFFVDLVKVARSAVSAISDVVQMSGRLPFDSSSIRPKVAEEKSGRWWGKAPTYEPRLTSEMFRSGGKAPYSDPWLLSQFSYGVSRQPVSPRLQSLADELTLMPSPATPDPLRARMGRQTDFTMMGAFRSGMGDATKDLRRGDIWGGAEENLRRIREIGESTIHSLSNGFEGFFEDLSAGTMSGAEAFKRMAASILKDINSILIRNMIAEPLAMGIGAAFGFGGTAAKIGAPVSHAGGIVGVTAGVTRMVDPGLFTGAPRFHSGLAPDEFPAILQRGEAVIPKNQVGGMAASGAVNITVNVDGSKGGSPEGNQRLGAEIARQIEAVIDQRIARAAMPRGILSR